jgi:Ca-activated chloride channel family protein
MELGLPGIAARIAPDPDLRGAALYRAGAFAEAASAFAEAGGDYNLGLAAARAGDYATALVAWERVLAASPGDREALANHTLVAALLAGTEFDTAAPPADRDREGPAPLANPGQGKARAAGQGDEATNPKTGFWMPEMTSEGLRRVPHLFDAQYMAANDRWLATLEDQPGAYLRARLALEQKARIKAGTALPDPEDPQ